MHEVSVVRGMVDMHLPLSHRIYASPVTNTTVSPITLDDTLKRDTGIIGGWREISTFRR